jgi:Homeodomain-like domain
VTTTQENFTFPQPERRVPVPDAMLIALYRQGASQRQAAEHLGISQAAVFKRWQKLRKKGLLSQDDNLTKHDILEPHNGTVPLISPSGQTDNFAMLSSQRLTFVNISQPHDLNRSPDNLGEMLGNASVEPTTPAQPQHPHHEIRAELEALGWRLVLSRGTPSLTEVQLLGRRLLALAQLITLADNQAELSDSVPRR